MLAGGITPLPHRLTYLASTPRALSSGSPLKWTRKIGSTSGIVFLGRQLGRMRISCRRLMDMPAVDVEHILRSKVLPVDEFWEAYNCLFEEPQ